MLKDLLEALDAMPRKRLIVGELERRDGEVCALGCLMRHRGLQALSDGPECEDAWTLGLTFDIAQQLAAEVTFENDEAFSGTPEGRWAHMRNWVVRNIRK
jgi:hypothetical protein